MTTDADIADNTTQSENYTDDVDATSTTTGEADSPNHGDIEPDDHGSEPSGNGEAMKYRLQRNQARAERDVLQGQIDAQRRALIDWRASHAPGGAVAPELLDAAGIDPAALCDESGVVDMAALDEFITSTAQRFRVHRAVAPNPQQGQPSKGSSATTWSDVINPRLSR